MTHLALDPMVWTAVFMLAIAIFGDGPTHKGG